MRRILWGRVFDLDIFHHLNASEEAMNALEDNVEEVSFRKRNDVGDETRLTLSGFYRREDTAKGRK